MLLLPRRKNEKRRKKEGTLKLRKSKEKKENEKEEEATFPLLPLQKKGTMLLPMEEEKKILPRTLGVVITLQI